MLFILLQIEEQYVPGWEVPEKGSLFKSSRGEIFFEQKLTYFFSHPEYGLAILLLLGLAAAYYYFAYWRGRFNPRNPQQSLHEPPLSLSPAAMRYIMQMGYDTKCLVVGIMNASIKGCYHIQWRKDRFLARQIENSNLESLSQDERLALTYSKDHYWDKVIVGNTHSTKTRKMSRRMDEFLKAKYGRLFKMKRDWLVGGIALTTLLGAIIFGMTEASHGAITWLGFNFVMWIGLILPGFFFYISVRDRYWYGLVISIFYLAAGIAALYFIEKFSDAPFAFPAAFPMMAMHYLFYRMLPGYTHRGSRIVNLILAYRNYLEDRFASLEEGVEADQTHFEEIPYAMALDIEYNVTGYFKNILSRTKYTPYRVFDYIYQ